MKGYVRSSPYFFRRIAWAAILVFLAAICGGFLFPAPLEEPADPGAPPNPAKSAWFLLWMQELVSYGNDMIYLVFLFAGWLAALPYLPWSPPCERARWFPKEQVPVTVSTLILFGAIAVLTAIAAFLRGENWALFLRF